MSENTNRKEWTWIDRAALGWPSGEWDGEPDKVHWKDATTGIDCLAVRHPSSGHWCGYVGVTEDHSAFGKAYDEAADVEVHGGVTFADYCQETTGPERGVCHVPFPGDPERVFWLGFDCAHSGDRSPLDELFAQERGYPWTNYGGERYKSLAYVEAQCRSLAAQLAQAA